MSLNTAKAYKNGILIKNPSYYTLIVPIELTITKSAANNRQFLPEINRQIFYLLHRNITRYTIFFKRTSKKEPKIQFNLYFQDAQVDALSLKTKQSIRNIKRYFHKLGIKLSLMNSNNYLQTLLAGVPESLTSLTNSIHKIVTKKGPLFLSIICLQINSEQNKDDFLDFLKDFYSHLDLGVVNIDVVKTNRNAKTKLDTKAAITIKLSSSNFETLKKSYNRILSLLKLLYLDNEMDISEKNYWFVTQKELTQNFGKLIIGQGWKFSNIQQTSWLDFAEYFNLLLL